MTSTLALSARQPSALGHAGHRLPIDVKGLRVAWSIAGRHRCAWADGPELGAEALLGLVESGQRFDGARGQLTTFAFARMQGRALDALRREGRLHRARVALKRAVAEVAQVAPSITARLDVGRAVIVVTPDLSSAERLVLREVYTCDRSMRELAGDGRWSEDQLHRAHRRLLARLRHQLQPNDGQVLSIQGN